MRKHEKSLVRVLFAEFGKERTIRGAEVGVWKGHLSAELLRFFPDLHLVMVDLWSIPPGPSSMRERDNNASAMLKAMKMARTQTEFASARRRLYQEASVDAARRFSVGSFDFVFIDADHYYKSVVADILAWWPRVKVGGILAGHDYNGVGDRRKGWGVKKAVDRFAIAQHVPINVEPGLVWWTKKTV